VWSVDAKMVSFYASHGIHKMTLLYHSYIVKFLFICEAFVWYSFLTSTDHNHSYVPTQALCHAPLFFVYRIAAKVETSVRVTP
jgi:hypothetical protein